MNNLRIVPISETYSLTSNGEIIDTFGVQLKPYIKNEKYFVKMNDIEYNLKKLIIDNFGTSFKKITIK